MSAPLVNLEERIAKLEAAAAGVRDATSEAHRATRDAVAARKELEAVEKRVQELFDGKWVEQKVDEVLAAAVKAAVAELGESTQDAMDAACEKVNQEFAKFTAILLGREPGATPLVDVAKQIVRKQEQTRQELELLRGGPGLRLP